MKKTIANTSPMVADALRVTGQLVETGRRERQWTVAELAARAGVSPRTVRAVEEGAPGTSFATVLEMLRLTGTSPFGVEDAAEMARMRRRGEENLALLPSRVYPARVEADDDF